MTEDAVGPRWGALAVVAPIAGVALAAATGWAIANPPATSGTPAVAPVDTVGQQQGGAVDKPLASLQQRAVTERARVIRLQQTLHRINAWTQAIAQAPVPGAAGASSRGGGHVSIAPPPVVAAPGPVPGTHTSTGAS